MAATDKSNSKAEVIETLSVALASTYALLIKTHNFHWNVTGPNFSQIHPFLETQYQELFVGVDEVAERIRQLGGVSPGGLTAFAKASEIKDAPAKPPTEKVMLETLAVDNEAMAKMCVAGGKFADEADDIVTTDLMTRRAAAHDKAAWMLRSHVS